MGAAGSNLEDTDHSKSRLVETGQQAGWLASVRAAADERGYGLVLNARVDVLIADRGAHPQAELVEDAIVRSRAYLAAGADCVYPIFLHDEASIGKLVSAVQGPVNILSVPHAPSRARLAELGVARISYGSGLHRLTMNTFAELLHDLV